MAYIRTMVNLPDTYERLAWQFLSGIPKGFSCIDLVADSYFNNSIKDAKRIKCGTSKSNNNNNNCQINEVEASFRV